MKNVMTRIVEWGKSLPFWEQIALDKIISGEPIVESDYDQILQYLLEEEGLTERVLARESPRFYRLTEIEDGASSSSIRLKSISNLININALVANQTLTFGEGVTAVYGQNGSGKSGYARVLASAAFTRGDREVLPNITHSKGKANPLSVDITITKDGIDQVLPYKVDRLCNELASFYVFDSTSVHVHMNDQNALSFSPAGLAYLKQLSDVTDQIRLRLFGKITDCCQDCEYANFFAGESEVNRLMLVIGSDTDLDHLKALATLSSAEKKRRSELAIQIANIELDKVKEQISAISTRISALDDFLRMLKLEEEALSDERLGSVNELLVDYQRFQADANVEGIGSFENRRLKSIGSPEWRMMIEAAKVLAYREGGEDYPLEHDVCILCQQPLSPQAHQLFHQMWDILRGQAQESLRMAQRSLDLEKKNFQEIKIISPLNDFPTISHLIGDGQADLLARIRETLGVFEERYNIVRSNINLGKAFDYECWSDDCLDDLYKFIEGLRVEKKRLEDFNIEQEVSKLEVEKRELDHRAMLGPVYENIKEYVNKRRWARDAEKAGGSTHHITTMHNTLFKELVTDEYVRIFEKTLKSMGRPLKVKIVTLGKKGQTLKQITLESAPDAKDIAKPEKVLSEGEKRAVALADFLTEVDLDTTSSGIILDDPVTSLDLEWRETIASMLVEKARGRQVIIFTHDLPFLYYLKNNTEKSGIPISTHWIKRGDSDGQPGYVYLDNSPALEKEYKKSTKALDLYKRALDADAEYQEFLLREGYGALRTTYEALIIFDLFSEVVMRFDERISFGRLKDIRWDRDLVAEVIEACERLSRNIEGHLHSDALSGDKKPTPDTLKEEIYRFDNLQKRLKELKKTA